MMTLGTLYLMPNVISESHLTGQIPTLVMEKARAISHFLVESAKPARHFLKTLEHPHPIATLSIQEIGHYPEPGLVDTWLAPLKEGVDIAIMSDAGCPGVADPGAIVVRRAHEWGVRVVPLVGPSSLLLTLMASGLNGQHFRFVGYLPQKLEERLPVLDRYIRDSALGQTILTIETPYRNQTLLEGLLAQLPDDTDLCIAQNITADNEWIKTDKVRAWKKAIPELLKVPTVFAFLCPQQSVKTHSKAMQDSSKKGHFQKPRSRAFSPQHKPRRSL